MARTIKHGDTWFIDDDNYDYSVEIQKAVDAGDFAKAAYLEKSRNAKIDRFVMPYEKTYLYQDYLPKVGKAAESISGASTTQVPSIGDSDYAKKMNSTLNKLGAMNFHYNANNDPLYKQIKQNYKNTVGDVIDNTMGSYAGMTGGMPSSFATSAAAQAGAQHLQKADDMIPELYQLAYNKFSDDKADLYKQFSIMQGLEEQAYSREWDKKSWDYQLEQDEKANALAEAKAQNDYEVSLAEIEADMLKEGNETQKQYFELAKDLVEMGSPPSDDIMALAGLGMTGQQFYDNYVTESNRVLAEKNKYTKASSGSSAKAKELKRPTTAMFDAIDKLFEEGEGASGLSKLMSKYDWETYDRGVIDEYISDNYGDKAGVLEYKYGDDIEGQNVDEWIDYINDALYDAWISSGKKGGNSRMAANESRKPHIYADEGGYRLAGDVTPTDVAEILFDSSLTDGQISYILESLGITEDEVDT